MSQGCNDGKEMYKIAWFTCKFVVLSIKTFYLFAVLLPSPSSLVLLLPRNSATMVTWRRTSPRKSAFWIQKYRNVPKRCCNNVFAALVILLHTSFPLSQSSICSYFGTRLTDLLKIFNLKMWYFLRHLRETEFILVIASFRSPFGYANHLTSICWWCRWSELFKQNSTTKNMNFFVLKIYSYSFTFRFTRSKIKKRNTWPRNNVVNVFGRATVFLPGECSSSSV